MALPFTSIPVINPVHHLARLVNAGNDCLPAFGVPKCFFFYLFIYFCKSSPFVRPLEMRGELNAKSKQIDELRKEAFNLHLVQGFESYFAL